MISVGIDISKAKSTVYILRPYRELVKPVFEVMHTVTEQEVFAAEPLTQKRDELRVVMEATGIYGLPILMQLQQAGLFVSVINPLVMKHYFSENVRHAKTDKHDALHIANYGIDHWFKLTPYQPKQGIMSIGATVCQLHDAKNTNKTEPAVAAGADDAGLLRNGASDRENNKLADFAEQCWHYANITTMSEDAFTADFLVWAKKKIPPQRFKGSCHPRKRLRRYPHSVLQCSIYQTARTGSRLVAEKHLRHLNHHSNTDAGISKPPA